MERFEFQFGSGRGTARRRDDDEPMRLLLLGDFSGAPAAERAPLAERRTHKVDIDTLDEVMRRLAPRMSADAGAIAFRELDDFHPDRLFARLELFQALRQARTSPPAATADVVGRLLGKAPAGTQTAAPANPIDALIHSIVSPHIAKEDAAQTATYTAAVDAAIAEQMRALLHSPAFQSLESVWRGVAWLVSQLELDERLQLHLLDVTRDELLADIVSAQGELARTGLHRAVVDRWRNVPGEPGWSAFVALFDFGGATTDVGLLAALGLVAASAGAPILGGAVRELAEEDRRPDGWDALRRSEAARWIGLGAPRVLLRLPYGRNTDRVETFAFEEITGEPRLEELLWGPASLALALLIGRAFTARGWEMEPGDEREIGDMPAYTFTRDGEPQLQAGAERYLTESQLQAILQRGIIPFASRRDRSAVVAIRFQSIADPPSPLAW